VRLRDREPTPGVSQRPARDTNFVCGLLFACPLQNPKITTEHNKARQVHAEIRKYLVVFGTD
jgi:hypothetical protein